jgi:hypothetical protein
MQRSKLFSFLINYYFLIFNSEFMNLLIVFVLNMDSFDFLILIPNLCILWINLDHKERKLWIKIFQFFRII